MKLHSGTLSCQQSIISYHNYSRIRKYVLLVAAISTHSTSYGILTINALEGSHQLQASKQAKNKNAAGSMLNCVRPHPMHCIHQVTQQW